MSPPLLLPSGVPDSPAITQHGVSRLVRRSNEHDGQVARHASPQLPQMSPLVPQTSTTQTPKNRRSQSGRVSPADVITRPRDVRTEAQRPVPAVSV